MLESFSKHLTGCLLVHNFKFCMWCGAYLLLSEKDFLFLSGAFEMTAKLQLLSNTNIGYHELQCLKLFDSNEQLLKFMRYYRSFDFLAPKVIQLDPQALSVRQNEQRVAWMLGMNPPNLAQHAKCNGREWRNQHQHEDGQGKGAVLVGIASLSLRKCILFA